MVSLNDAHRCLMRYQTTAEIERKAMKARSKHNMWTQEEIDLGKRKAAETGQAIGCKHDEYDLSVND